MGIGVMMPFSAVLKRNFLFLAQSRFPETNGGRGRKGWKTMCNFWYSGHRWLQEEDWEYRLQGDDLEEKFSNWLPSEKGLI